MNALALWLATGFKVGQIRSFMFQGMAGTYGTVAGLLLFLFIDWLVLSSVAAHVAVIVLLFAIGLWSIPMATIVLGPQKDWKGNIKTKDQNQIVIDEILGIYVVCLFCVLFCAKDESLKYGWILAMGFVLFRIFDITKPWPISLVDKDKSAFGVIADDFVAAFLSVVVMFVVYIYLGGPV